MRAIFAGVWQWRKDPWQDANGIDFGNGTRLGAEDVLDYHFQRLARSRRIASSSRVCTVPIQVGDNLIAAIAVLAPALAPLTELAETVADVVPPMHPTPQFRATLHDALERTHRQHNAQRVLGTRQQQAVSQKIQAAWWVVAFAALSILLVMSLWLFRVWSGKSSPSPANTEEDVLA
jgi:hypothetical protein